MARRCTLLPLMLFTLEVPVHEFDSLMDVILEAFRFEKILFLVSLLFVAQYRLVEACSHNSTHPEQDKR